MTPPRRPELSRLRRALFWLVCLSLPLVVFAVVLEAVARLTRAAPPTKAELDEQLKRSAETEVVTIPEGSTMRGLARPSADPDMVYELKPSHQWLFQGAAVRTNALGFRGPEWVREKAPDTLRVVGLGDSVMFGWGVEEKDAYLTRLAVLLNAQQRRGRVEVLNCAVPGYNSAQEAALFAARAAGLGGDVLVWGYNLNDWTAPFLVQDPKVGCCRTVAFWSW